MKSNETYSIEVNNKAYLREHFMGRKSALVDLLLSKFIETHKENPNAKEIVFKISKIKPNQSL